MNLKLYKQEGIELVIDMSSGESFATYAGYSRMAKIDPSTVTKRIKSSIEKKQEKEGQAQTARGIRLVKLLSEDIIADWIVDDNPKLAKQMLKAGVRLYMHGLAGIKYKPQSNNLSLYVLKPRTWTKTFCDEFYDHISRLTGMPWDKKTHQRSHVFATWTRKLVYDHLPADVVSTIKSTKKDHKYYFCKMHQFLNPDGITLLEAQLNVAMQILKSASSISEADRLITQSVTKNYQLSIFDA